MTKKQLLCSLRDYTDPKNCCYDPEFDREIRKRAPHLFVRPSSKKKETLQEMADRGEPRPSYATTAIGQALFRYTYNKSNTYDPGFDREIRKRAPHWFVDTAAKKKKLLLEMAYRGEPRPSCEKPLGAALLNYLRERGGSYDPGFDREIRKHAPHWFIDTAEENKRTLLAMAQRGEPRPSQKKKQLGARLCAYTSKASRCYDSAFDAKLCKLRPDWFVTTVELGNKTKAKIKAHYKAKGDLPRPSHDLYESMIAFCSRDEKFKRWCHSHGLGSRGFTLETSTRAKEQVKLFFKKHGRLPKRTNKNAKENQLANKVRGFCRSNDPEFAAWVHSVGYGFAAMAERWQTEIRDFYSSNQRLPSSAQGKEKRLWAALLRQCKKNENFRSWAKSVGFGSRYNMKYKRFDPSTISAQKWARSTNKQLAKETGCSESTVGNHRPNHIPSPWR